MHTRFSRWAEGGVWKRVFEHLAGNADNEYATIDSTIVRAHQHSAGAKKSRRGPSDRALARRTEHENSRHIDALGNPTGFFLTGGQAHDLVGADHRWHVNYTPTSASWTNQVERFFALLTDRAIRRGVFRSVADLEAAITAYIKCTNAAPKPFQWTKSADDILASIQRFCRRTLAAYA